MATKEWLDKHAKITVYLDLSLYASLEKWMAEHKIKKNAQAVSIILEHYLEGNIPTDILPDRLAEEVKQLKVKVTEIDEIEATVAEQNFELTDEVNSLKAELEEMRQVLINAGLASLKEKTEDIPRGRIDFSYTDQETENGLTKEDLCKKIHISSSKINQWAIMLTLDPEDYLYELTGWNKPSNSRRYFPSSNKIDPKSQTED